MLTVHCLAEPAVVNLISNALASEPDMEPGLRTHDVREVLEFRYGDDDVVVLDDAVVGKFPSLIGALADLAVRKLTIGYTGDAAAARRALLVGSLAMIEASRITEELLVTLRELVPAQVTQAPWLGAVYSAKGGVGKSTVALNLAWALALQSEHPVALVDCDPLGDIGAMIQDRPGATLGDVVRGLAAGMPEDKALASFYRVKGLDLTIAPAASLLQQSELVTPEDLGRIVTLLQQSHAYVVMDLATGLGEHNLAAMDRASEVYVLAVPERVTLTTVSRSLDVLRHLYPDKLTLLLNRSDSDTGIDKDGVQKALGFPVRYELPSGGSAPIKAANRGRPLVLAEPKNSLSRAISAMAQEMVHAREGVRRSRRRWFAR